MTDKTRIQDLAALGGPPAFTRPLFVGRPNIGDRQALLARINDILDRRWLTNNGSYVQEFERRLAARLGVRHCIPMCNGTVALEIAIRALGLTGEVIVPSFTFVATAHALQWQQVTPVFCDVDPATHLIDPAQVEALVTPRTTGIIGVHLWGRVCDVAALQAIADRRGLALMFDAAHALGAKVGGRHVGTFGRAEVFSFHATKFFNTFEGGAIATDDDELAARIRLMKNFGFAGYDQVVHLGINGKMPEVSAAMGLTSLEAMDDFIAVNRAHWERYHRALSRLPGITLVDYRGLEQANYQYVALEVDEAQAGLHRDQLVAVLQAENVVARRYFYPGCHRMEPYRSAFPDAGLRLPETERLCQRILSLPTGTGLEAGDVDGVCALIRFALANAAELRRRLPAPAPA